MVRFFTDENPTDKVAHEYLTKYPHMESYFPEDTQRGTHREQNSSQQAATRKKDLDQAEKAGKEEE